jgi:phenylpropionate dioxygenase-like ring-hydroxylating dioxygenase large terminal subunit
MTQMYKTSGLLVNHWYAVGQSKKFKPEVPVSVTVFEIPLVVWRMKEGSLTTILDRCNHRNAPLSKGKIINNCIVCPYHGWTYNHNGQCIDIPSEGPNKDRIPNKRVESFPVREAYGLIWVWMGEDKSPMEEPFEMPLMKELGWHSYYMETKFNSNVTDLVENFMDVPHTVFVHKGWFRDRKQICVKANVKRTTDSVLVTYDQSNDSIGFSGWLVNPKRLPMMHSDNFYMPNITRVDYIFGSMSRGFIITSTCTPISPFETIVYTLISYKFGWLTPLARLGLAAYTKKVINQDVWIMDIHSQNIMKFGGTDYKSTQCDYMHLYIESLREYAQEVGEKPELLSINKEIEFWI